MTQEGQSGPLSGFLAEGPVGPVGEILVSVAIDVCRSILAPERDQNAPLTSVDELLIQMGLPLAAPSGLLERLREEISAVRESLANDEPDPRSVSAVAKKSAARARARRGSVRYKLQIGQSGAGRTVLLHRMDGRRHWDHIHTFESSAAAFMQQLAWNLRESLECVDFENTVRILRGGRKTEEATSEQAQEAIRAAIYRKLPEDVDHRDLVKSVRGCGYRLCESVDISGDVGAPWDRPTLSRSASAHAQEPEPTLNAQDRRALALLNDGLSFPEIQAELGLSDPEWDATRKRLQAHGEAQGRPD